MVLVPVDQTFQMGVVDQIRERIIESLSDIRLVVRLDDKIPPFRE